jgi:sugar phosphate isomerase/epimerase
MLQLCARAKSVEDGRAVMAQGFDRLEITLPCPGGPKEEREWSALGREQGLVFLAHGPEEGNPRDLSHLEEIYLPKIQAALEASCRLHVRVLTLHLWLEPRFLPGEVILAKIGFLEKAVAWGLAQGVSVHLENLSEDHVALAEALARIPDLKLTLDLGHAMLLHETSTAPEIVRRFYSRIGHLHLHDNRGGKSPRDDLHLVPGEGVVPFGSVFQLLKERGYDGTATLELAPSEMERARAFILRTWKSS